MSKERTTICLKDGLLKKAQDLNLNVSALTERAIRSKVDGSILAEDEDKICHFCNYSSGASLIWLCPDEVWTCERCLKERVEKVKIGLFSRR